MNTRNLQNDIANTYATAVTNFNRQPIRTFAHLVSTTVVLMVAIPVAAALLIALAAFYSLIYGPCALAIELARPSRPKRQSPKSP